MPRIRPLLLAAASPAAPFTAQGQQQYELGGEAEIYNLVGSVRIEAGSGSAVQVEVTTGGADANKLKIEVDGAVLRVIYPGDRIRYARMEHAGSTTLHVNEDGMFDGRQWRRGRRVRIARDDGDLEAWADLRISPSRWVARSTSTWPWGGLPPRT